MQFKLGILSKRYQAIINIKDNRIEFNSITDKGKRYSRNGRDYGKVICVRSAIEPYCRLSHTEIIVIEFDIY